MIKEHIQTFLILAERARQAGLIQFNEMPAVLHAIDGANAEMKQQETPTEPGKPGARKAEKNEQNVQGKAG